MSEGGESLGSCIAGMHATPRARNVEAYELQATLIGPRVDIGCYVGFADMSPPAVFVCLM